jgi:hypothetical protein
MFNKEELKARRLPIALDGALFLTTRSVTVVTGATQTIYQGFAYPGSSEATATWLIQRTTVTADGSTATLFADGHALFDQVWTDYASLSYS